MPYGRLSKTVYKEGRAFRDAFPAGDWEQGRTFKIPLNPALSLGDFNPPFTRGEGGIIRELRYKKYFSNILL